MADEKKNLREKAVEEFRLMMWIAACLVAFFAFLTHRRLISREFGVTSFQYGFAVVEALIVATAQDRWPEPADNGWVPFADLPIEFDESIVKYPSIKRFPGGASNDLIPNLQHPENPVPLVESEQGEGQGRGRLGLRGS